MGEARGGIDMYGVDFSFSELSSLAKEAYGSQKFSTFVNAHLRELGMDEPVTAGEMEDFVENFEGESGCSYGIANILRILCDVVTSEYGSCWCDVSIDECDTAFFGIPKLVIDAWDVDADVLSKFPSSAQEGERAIRKVWEDAGFDPLELPEFFDMSWAWVY